MTIQCALGYVNGATLTCCGKTATAAQAKDNLNELLNMLHIGGLNAGARTPSGPPDSPVCTARLFEKDVLTFRVLVPAGSQTQEVYLQDETDPPSTARIGCRHPFGPPTCKRS